MSSKNKNSNNKAKANRISKKGAAANRTNGGRKYSLLRKLPLSLLLAFAAPMTVCFFGPFETYCGNMGEFAFSLGDFLPLCLALGAAIGAVLFGILMLADGRFYDILCAVIAWLTVMAFSQRYYLNLGVNALVGDGVGNTEVSPEAVFLNAAIWVAVGVLTVGVAILIKKKNIAPFFVACAAVLIAVMLTEVVGFASLSVSTDVYTPVTERAEAADTGDGKPEAKEPAALTYKNLDKLSGEKNVIFFLIDRFDIRYFEALQKKEPEFFDKLDGFTLYNDYTSLYCRTYPAIASILTGEDNDFEDTRLNYFKEIYTDGGPMRDLHDAGYDVNIYTEKYYAYDDASYMSDYVSNLSGSEGYEIDDKYALAGDMLRLSLSTYLPFTLKGIVGTLSTPDFNAHAIYDTDLPVYDADMKNVYDYITRDEFTTTAAAGQFSFIHIFGCHTPVKYNLNWEEANDTEKNDTTMALKQSLTIIYEYIEQMKRLGVYEDATIVITGDHPAALSDTKLIGEASKYDNGTRVTTMLFKRSGDSYSELKTSQAQISQDELWATIFESEGLMSLKSGESFFDIGEDEQRVRRYLFEMSVYLDDNERADEIVQYKITGSARDRENWEIEKRTEIGKIYK